MTAKWTYDDKAFKEIRLKLDQIKFSPVRDQATVDRLFVSHVVSHTKEFALAYELEKPINPLDYYWAVALWAYFPGTAVKYHYRADNLLMKCPAPASY